ncbi:MAG: ABC transporter ATP-binding protein [Nocardioides sp.]
MATQPPPERAAGIGSLWRLKGYLRPYVGSLIVMATVSVLGVVLTIVIPLVTSRLIDGPIADGDRSGVLPLGSLAIGLGVLEAYLIWQRRWVQSNAVLGLETTMRHDLYAKLQSLPMSFHAQWGSGQLLSRATTDLSAIRRFSGFGLLFLIINVLQLIATTIVLLNMYWPLGLVVAAAAAPIIWLCFQFEKGYSKISRQVQDEQGDLATVSEEGAVGIRVIKSFGRSGHVASRFEAQAQQLRETSIEKVRLSAKFFSFLDLIPNAAVSIVLALGAVGVGNGLISVGELVAFITLMLSLVWPISSLGVILAMAQEAMSAAARILEIFDTESTVESGTRRISEPRGQVRFEGVRFAFADDPDEEILRGVDLEIEPGETVALVGATGAGKTLLTALVPRLYDATAGSVRIDGVDVRDLDLSQLRTIVATAFEDPILFSMSARENLTLGRIDATVEEIEQAIEVAQAGFVYDLPWGLDTRLGEQGLSLSGGQRQRLALARAVLAQPKVLILDDTLSALDVHTEALVEEALKRVLTEVTGIVVAHRASTLHLADRVALLADGRITHIGKHSVLMATVPAYRDLLVGYELGQEAAG